MFFCASLSQLSGNLSFIVRFYHPITMPNAVISSASKLIAGRYFVLLPDLLIIGLRIYLLLISQSHV